MLSGYMIKITFARLFGARLEAVVPPQPIYRCQILGGQRIFNIAGKSVRQILSGGYHISLGIRKLRKRTFLKLLDLYFDLLCRSSRNSTGA